jgi:hypothetical protein
LEQFIFWAFAYKVLYKRTGYWTSASRTAETLLNFVMLLVGAFFFVGGTYAACQSIKISYATGAIKAPFGCVNSGFTFTR